MHPKNADGIANSVDPDKTDLGLHCLPSPFCPKTQNHYGNSVSSFYCVRVGANNEAEAFLASHMSYSGIVDKMDI